MLILAEPELEELLEDELLDEELLEELEEELLDDELLDELLLDDELLLLEDVLEPGFPPFPPHAHRLAARVRTMIVSIDFIELIHSVYCVFYGTHTAWH